ncbi:muscarinic acetylcholine receptor M2-like [Strongylocentrotus purpuratus]|uniref:G-protein coupled receptors family 1 profile domain-containing protein n=1 Tax=Strongylocentrotus purpuratus TaxID=7668 RepID=A0A7M7HRB3_STRPU|nr:muscarinic acetylcholine receptor M2-like [Strongylocentrotus purpuratus]|eukprot:XP_011684105.1 PREDICTED: muscarinic acetylcholine receptor M2-like [Strongylocentrotus purpuratus]
MSTDFELTTELPPNPSPDFTQKLVAVVLCGLIFCMGVGGNTLVLLAISTSRRLQSHSNRFLGFLAITDLLTCLLLPIQIAALLDAKSEFFRLACGVAGVMGYVTLGSSAYTLALIAFNRYICITQPLTVQKKIFSRCKSTVMASFGVLFPLITTSAFVVTGNARTGLLDGIFCTIVYGPLLDMLAGSFLLMCVLVTLIFYLLIAKAVRSHSRRVIPPNPAHQEIITRSGIRTGTSSNEACILGKQVRFSRRDYDASKSGSCNQSPTLSSTTGRALRIQEPCTSNPDKIFVPETTRMAKHSRRTREPISCTSKSVSVSSVQAISTTVHDQEETTRRPNQGRLAPCPKPYVAPVPLFKLETEVAKNMILIVLAFLIALVFTLICVLITDIPNIYDLFTYVVLSANSSINPIIYGWRHPLLKRTFRHILRWRLEEIDQPTRWVRKCIY